MFNMCTEYQYLLSTEASYSCYYYHVMLFCYTWYQHYLINLHSEISVEHQPVICTSVHEPDLAGGLGQAKDSCSMKNKEIRIVHNMLPPFLVVNNGAVDHTTLEAPFLTTFLERFLLRPSFIFANRVWGNKNKSTGIWSGMVGLV